MGFVIINLVQNNTVTYKCLYGNRLSEVKDDT